ncbi:MAG TPA: phage tail sheath subtilisin-like domain-containing protein [Pyrinomonadaceae bacterium]|nr:phage tail sheath subtilisin-like domain-containing protein [Pyrinomonadaceae bacterium]
MPVQVSYPGVYIQEVSSGVHTITGVSTSIAAFFGRTAKGPIDRAVRCLSFADFIREFGGPHPLSDLAQSVRQFFDNGGTDCYVVRLAAGALPAKVTLRNLANTKNVLVATAKAPGLWGQDIKLEVDYNTANPDDTFNLRVSYEVNGVVVSQEDFSNLSMMPASPRFAPTFVTQSSKLIDLALDATDMGVATDPAAFINTSTATQRGYSQSRRPFVGTVAALITEFEGIIATKGKFSMSVNGSAPVAIDITAKTFPAGLTTLQQVADEIAGMINPQLNASVAGLNVKAQWDALVPAGINAKVLRLTSDTADFSRVTITRAPSSAVDFATALMMGLDQGGVEVARWSNLRPVFNGTVHVGGGNFGDFTDGSAGLNQAFAGLTQGTMNSIQIAGSAPVGFNLVTGLPGDRNFQHGAGTSDGVREKLRIIADAVNADPNVPWKAELWGYHLALRKKQGTINDSAIVTTGGLAGAQAFGLGFIANVRRYSLGASGTGIFQSGGTAGTDGGVPGVAQYAGNEALHTGFYALDKVDLFNLMVLPGDRELTEAIYLQLLGPASIYCTQKRAFLLVDAPDSWTEVDHPVATATEVNNLRTLVVKDHSAVFYPKLVYSDAGIKKLIGASGIIAGLMARIDSTRGVWKAPAGTEADLRGVLDVEVNLTDLENGVLNKLGVNCIRKFPSGIVNWGARTLDGSDDIGSEWKYIPIRRLALFLEESLFRGTKWVVFEPNDEPLWAKIRLNLNAFMMSLFRQGAFQGSTPDKAFYVKCDGETTTQNDRNLGIVNIEIGFAPLKPAEFVVIKIQQIAGDL